MARIKSEVLTIRTTPRVKALLRLAAEHEHRSLASMIEVMVLNYAGTHGLAVPDFNQPARTESSLDVREAKDPE
ncbi:hypothetical protein [Thiocapsa marina]|uniref:Uncharacterized protein n=1 Tax=Thiocapsa marina 5811 TaxID=768671 RepID=F9UCZ9_9GAMM|nr:hypothetical protein [Thiocapsa marina]EGV17743.1 protein of unknown function DUF1778 [Thiocapsa marina 5811]